MAQFCCPKTENDLLAKLFLERTNNPIDSRMPSYNKRESNSLPTAQWKQTNSRSSCFRPFSTHKSAKLIKTLRTLFESPIVPVRVNIWRSRLSRTYKCGIILSNGTSSNGLSFDSINQVSSVESEQFWKKCCNLGFEESKAEWSRKRTKIANFYYCKYLDKYLWIRLWRFPPILWLCCHCSKIII